MSERDTSHSQAQRDPDEIEQEIHQSRERLDATLHQIEERFSPEQWLHTTYDYLRHGGANEFFANLGTTVKQNPVPTLLTGAGLGWLMLRQSNGPDRHRHAHGHATDVHPRPTPPDEVVTPPRASAGQHDPRSDATGTGIKDRVRHVGHSAHGAAQQVGEKAHQWGGRMHDSMSHAQQGTQHRVDHMKERAHHASDRSSDFIQEHPLVVGALGFALGAALASMSAMTRKENETLGEYRNQAMDQATKMGEAQVDRAQHAIHDKAESVKQHAHEQREQRHKEDDNPTQHNEPVLAGSSTPSGNTQGAGTNGATPGSVHPTTPGATTTTSTSETRKPPLP
ncbi:DUF3618 domain-containing protein [Vreelandella aquamarina]|uniref:DUF3618 domain-containing protein n=1 Tax=Vreelandella aquamarina TaxID=77097 RepID=A0A857GK06_9GAMM|nr:DUF3618 domain-containing protein [Halomonas meridiana]QHD48906.1 hypothetical protein CTT34_03975 [Halomonas meridiana]